MTPTPEPNLVSSLLQRLYDTVIERDDCENENKRLRLCIRNQRGDDLCHITDLPQAMALPQAEFLESCRRYHDQISRNGTLEGGRTIAQLEARIVELEQLLKEVSNT